MDFQEFKNAVIKYAAENNIKDYELYYSKEDATSVEIFKAFAFPFFNTDTLAIVIPTLSASSVTLIFLFASITSMLKMISPSIASLLIWSNHFVLAAQPPFLPDVIMRQKPQRLLLPQRRLQVKR